MSHTEKSVFQGDLPLDEKLERARMELLDLSARNRLLHVPRFSKSAKTIDVVDEKSAEIFRLLVRENRPLTFLPGRPDRAVAESTEENVDEAYDDGLGDFESPAMSEQADEEQENEAAAARHSDTRLQTRMTPKGLQKRLLDLYHDARTLEEEQGVNILFLGLGTLNWVDPNKKENIRHAPLVLVPVSLERGTAGERFRLRLRPEDLISNLSLEAYLDRVHTLKLPSFDGGDEFDPAVYFSAVAEAVSSKPDWTVAADNVVLGFFSFAKFLMYRDLDPENWPADSRLTDHATIRALLADGFEQGEPSISEDVSIDAHIQPTELLHIVDSDSSQTLAVHDVRRGGNLVIQGPPGTGKSQTIANVIASAVADGKTVLFVAEKMAALEVVKRRLDQAGVGDICLELHSNKANKRGVLEELRRTWELGSPRGDFPDGLAEKLKGARDLLNGHAARMHARLDPSGITAFQVIGHLTRLRQSGQPPVDFELETPSTWNSDECNTRGQLVSELVQRIQDIGLPADHPWNGVGLQVILPTAVERLSRSIASIDERMGALRAGLEISAKRLDQHRLTERFGSIQELPEHACQLAAAPDFSSEALSSSLWEKSSTALRELLRRGEMFSAEDAALSTLVQPGAMDARLEGLETELQCMPDTLPSDAYARARQLKELIPLLQTESRRLGADLGSLAPVDTLAQIERLTATAERVAVAPEASPDAFTAAVWDHGVEQAADLVSAVVAMEKTRDSVDGKLLEVAWTTDVRAARQTLATHTGFLRYLNGTWRQANALVRSIVTDPKAPASELVSVLDVLMQGQAAAAKVREGDAFGRSAFGHDWRGDRSRSAPMLALVEWMRTLRGLGAEPRLIASRLEQRATVGARARRVRQLVQQVAPLVTDLWDSLGAAASELLGEAPSAEQAPLSAFSGRVEKMVWSDDLLHQVLLQVPPDKPAKLALARRLDYWQKLAKQIDRYEEHARAAFGDAWSGRRSDWPRLVAGAEWMEAHPHLRQMAARTPDRIQLAEEVRRLAQEASSLESELASLATALEADAVTLFGVESMSAVSLEAAQARIAAWLANTEQLSKWVTYRDRSAKARTAGLSQLVDRLIDGRVSAAEARSSFEMAYYEALLSELAKNDPEIGRFDGDQHSQLVAEFATLDQQRIKASSMEVVRAHHRKIPAREGGIGPVGVLRAEMARRRGHMPIRQLMQKSGLAVQALKPVMMMSPLSVAQFLTPGRLTFDLLVMDEASQIQPVDALGAIARCKQVVVVGDERQLPPTKFFAKMTGSQPDDDGDDDTPVADIESILGLFSARGLPQRMLRWHYRSRHQSLIAISNSQFYENKLYIVPSPYTKEAGMGLRFHHVPEGRFDSGGTGTNAIEARAVAEAIIRHAKANPAQSLGVATFSVSQRRAIQDELEGLRRLNPDTEEFFHAHPSEPFFVKNLENVQGDERDVIMISVGYARNAQGYMAMRFGPLGADGGERRLNVLISRAKRCCEVFASITDEDIDLARVKGKGVFAFKLFLHYARTGRLSIAQATDRDMDSIFEEQVASALQAKGYQLHPQVGIAGFFIDLAVADPEHPGRYLLGIECDGASYHSARSARDRDRLRQAVLEDHGWIIHRIWSTDWFQRPAEQLERTIRAIEAAKIQLDAQLELAQSASRAIPVQIVTIEREDVTQIGLADSDEASTGRTYVEAEPARSGAYDLHETPLGVMAELVASVVQVESPVHVDEVTTRLRTAWGLQRTGARIEAAVHQGIQRAQAMGRIEKEDGFLSVPGALVTLRNRSSTRSAGLRKPEMIAPKELAAGISNVVLENFGATPEEVVSTISRQLGFKATSATLRRTIELALDDLICCGALARENNMVVSTRPTSSIIEPEGV